MLSSPETHRRTEAEVLESFGLRWAVLSAWNDDLRSRGVAFDGELAGMLVGARVKIASGCFSSCEIGCDLARIEAALVSRSATFDPAGVDEWIETLSQVMTAPEGVKSRRWFKPVFVSDLGCGYRPCACPD